MNKKNLAGLIGASLAASVSLAPLAAQANPFGATDLNSGYQNQTFFGDKGEAKCGGDKAKKEGKCGGDKAKKEGKCGEGKAKKEGKCGEGKCGAKNKAKKEGKCGAEKSKEGKCGEKK